ncbi:HAD family hydrolase [Bacteriovorax sp. Seq25_V]|uniref:KdsC family phosphatase n=1 Tax=Bacteriovorax sp. Seq25_V TaxID=1201288 RepID=UPI00038A3B21|nr:HAD family hydrolase [Bacteriovorax sp. Seq25_V]EQC46614.1 3-deoxy-D-manno-octulosonate 8-phosphate phosphatase, YrbI family [Bacteriovorax sp. Seq25_V]
MNLFEIAKKFESKLSKIKVAAFDIDGVLTNGHVWWDDEALGFNRLTHTSDGYGLKLLMEAGIKTGVISGGNSVSVQKRFEENLKLDFAFLGNEDKREAYKKILEMGYKAEEILFMGDELFDIPLLKASGFAATVTDAPHEVKAFCDYVSVREGGKAAVREVIDIVRYAQGFSPEILDFDGSPIDLKNTWPKL